MAAKVVVREGLGSSLSTMNFVSGYYDACYI